MKLKRFEKGRVAFEDIDSIFINCQYELLRDGERARKNNKIQKNFHESRWKTRTMAPIGVHYLLVP